MRVMSMPDKWEYPWFAAWDLAFQCVPFALVDAKFAKDQLWMLLFEQFQHPSGQLPAYEWEFGDLNPPVHAWAVWRVYNMDRIRNGHADREWLERCFHKLLINFASWVNKVDRDGNNVFEGGFLGLDNITVIDRSEPSCGRRGARAVRRDRLDGHVLPQPDADRARARAREPGLRGNGDEVPPALRLRRVRDEAHGRPRLHAVRQRGRLLLRRACAIPTARSQKFRVRSLVGLIPLFAVERLELEWIEPFKEFTANLNWFLKNRRDLVEAVIHPHRAARRQDDATCLRSSTSRSCAGCSGRIYDEREFLSRYGIRSLSKLHEAQPFEWSGRRVAYEPAESVEKLKGGNSNWRGPIWFPTTFLIIESLRKLGTAFGPCYLVETPGSGGQPIALQAIARDIARRMIDIFLLDKNQRRPVYGGAQKFADDPHWRDHLLFYEYFHGDNGAGIGASHQTGWTALVANLIDEWH